MRRINTVAGLLAAVFAIFHGGCGDSSNQDPNLTLPPPTPEVFFDGTYEDAQAMSRQTGKPLVVCAGADWSMPYTRMNETTWLDPTLTAWLTKNTVPFLFDIDDDPDTAQRLNLQVPIPIIVIYKNGVESTREVGEKSAQDMLAWLKSVV